MIHGRYIQVKITYLSHKAWILIYKLYLSTNISTVFPFYNHSTIFYTVFPLQQSFNNLLHSISPSTIIQQSFTQYFPSTIIQQSSTQYFPSTIIQQSFTQYFPFNNHSTIFYTVFPFYNHSTIFNTVFPLYNHSTIFYTVFPLQNLSKKHQHIISLLLLS